jgi:hypothetical protein
MAQVSTNLYVCATEGLGLVVHQGDTESDHVICVFFVPKTDARL